MIAGLMDEDPLSKLVVRKDEVNRKLLADVLDPFSMISQETGEALLKPPFAALPGETKVLVYLLTRKASRALDTPLDREEASPTEISRQTGMNYNSVKPSLSKLYQKRLVQKRDDGYFVPDHAIFAVGEMLPQLKKRGDLNRD